MIEIMCACVIDIVLILQQFFSFLFFEVICKKKIEKKINPQPDIEKKQIVK